MKMDKSSVVAVIHLTVVVTMKITLALIQKIWKFTKSMVHGMVIA